MRKLTKENSFTLTSFGLFFFASLNMILLCLFFIFEVNKWIGCLLVLWIWGTVWAIYNNTKI